MSLVRVNIKACMVVSLPCPVRTGQRPVYQALLRAGVISANPLDDVPPEAIFVVEGERIGAFRAVRRFAAKHFPGCAVIPAYPGDAIALADEMGWPLVILGGRCNVCPKHGSCWRE